MDRQPFTVVRPSHEPARANPLPQFPPLPFRREEGRGEGPVLSREFLIPMRVGAVVEAPQVQSIS
jgi:hypothetical protein